MCIFWYELCSTLCHIKWHGTLCHIMSHNVTWQIMWHNVSILIWVFATLYDVMWVARRLISEYQSCHIMSHCTGWRRLKRCLKLQIIFPKEWRIVGLFCRKWPVKIRHPMGLRHPVPLSVPCATYGSSPHDALFRMGLPSGVTVQPSWEVGGWGRDPKKCTGSIWGMGSSTI